MSKLNVKSMEKVNELIKIAAVKAEIKRLEEKMLEFKLAACLNLGCEGAEDVVLRIKELKSITLA